MKYIPAAVMVLLLAAVAVLAGCGPQVPVGPPSNPSSGNQPANTNSSTSTTPTQAQTPEPPFFAMSVIGEALTRNIFGQPVLTVFVVVENGSSQLPITMLRANAVLFGNRGQQLGTKSWGSRPIVVAPHMQVPIAYTFDTAEWQNVSVSVPEYRGDKSLISYDGLVTAKSVAIQGDKDLIVYTTIQNAGQFTACEITAIVLGYDQEGAVVAWAYNYPSSPSLKPGTAAEIEFTKFLGDSSRMVQHRVFLYSQREK